MTFKEFVHLSDEGLCLAIEEYCYGRIWHEYSRGPGGAVYVLAAPGLQYCLLSDLDYLASWDKTMRLHLDHGDTLTLVVKEDRYITVTDERGTYDMVWETETDIRRRVCKNVLWKVLRQTPHS
jgi:hypothetical protein